MAWTKGNVAYAPAAERTKATENTEGIAMENKNTEEDGDEDDDVDDVDGYMKIVQKNVPDAVFGSAKEVGGWVGWREGGGGWGHSSRSLALRVG